MGIPVSGHRASADGADGRAASIQIPEDGGPVALPAASLIADGNFFRAGPDLVIGDAAGNQLTVRGYFLGEEAPDLTSPDGSQVLTPDLLHSFLMPMAPGQYAQAASVTGAAPVGQVLDLDGNGFAVHADGTRVQLAKGDAVYEGDVIETGGAGSAIRMVFTDKTEFSLGADARLALDQLVFNPDTQSGSAQFSVLKGVFIFASGQIAKTDNTDMTVITPVATIGIRGTEVAGRVSASDSQFTVIDGAIEVTTQAGSVTLDDRGETTQIAGNDAAPSDPLVLTPAQFGQAYGEVAGVVSNYFDQSQPGPQDQTPGGSPEPGAPPVDAGDRADGGTDQDGSDVAAGLPPETGNLPVLAATLAETTTVAAAPATSFVTPLGAGLIGGATAPAIQPGSTGFAGLVGSGIGTAAASASGTGAESVQVVAVPGLDFGGGLTFAPTDGAAVGAGSFELVPSGNQAAAPGDIAQVSFTPTPGGPADAGTGIANVNEAGSASPPLDQISTGSSGSPFRGESGSGNAFAGNPYITDPFGYSGPQLGDPVFNLVAGGSSSSGGAVNAGPGSRDEDVAVQVAPGGGQSGPGPAPVLDPVEITLIVSNATINQQDQDLTHSEELPNLGPDSKMLVAGSDLSVPGIPANAEISVHRDAGGNVDVALTSAWDSVKNIRAESATAADITIDNFVHADVHFGDGGDSHITILDAKRGSITTGNGSDTIEIDAYSNGPGWSHTFDVRSGDGNDLLMFNGASNGLSHLFFDGGSGLDTLQLSGAGQSFSLLPGQIEVANVERIDISGTGITSLTVSSASLDPSDAAFNGTGMLVIDGDQEDILSFQDNGWDAPEFIEIEGHGYAVYEHASGMKVAADIDITVI
jgi:hypothetical protein